MGFLRFREVKIMQQLSDGPYIIPVGTVVCE